MHKQSSAYPSLEQYQEALQNPLTSLTDSQLRTGIVATSGLGVPLALCGGFALTYTLNCGTEKFAVRCFHKHSGDLERRYDAIARSLARLNSPYFVDFKYLAGGIRVGGSLFPIVKMSWVPGETLGEFLENKHGDKLALQQLRRSLGSLEHFLIQSQIAHGDLQPGNIIVSGNGSVLKLIDYDGMFVDELKTLGSSELGQRNFQHPGRTASDFDSRLDRFSFILLDCALEALAADSGLWGSTGSDSDALIFRANDFADPSSAKSFTLIKALSSVSESVRKFERICSGPYSSIPTLEDFKSGRNIPIAAATIGIAKPAPQYLAPHPVINAADYAQCERQIGNRVELIGQVVSVKLGKARTGKPYVFVNFGDWKGNVMKLAIWSEGLRKLQAAPDESWVGRWVSAVGLVDAPYKNPKYGTVHLSITIGERAQMTTIAEADARFRLGGLSTTTKPSSQNAKVLQQITGFAAPSNATPSSTQSKNQQVLSRISRQAPTPSAPKSSPASNPSQQTPIGRSASGGCLVVLIILGSLGLLAGRAIIPMSPKSTKQEPIRYANTSGSTAQEATKTDAPFLAN